MLEPRHLLNGGPIISEFMASNSSTLADEDGDFEDWLEIHNPTSDPIVLDGWYLTDSASNLKKWRFPNPTALPDLVLDPDQYLVVFTSGKNLTNLAGTLHTSFSLSAGGEYLALVEPNGLTIAHHYAPKFPPQQQDVSYGVGENTTALVRSGAAVGYYVPNASDASLGSGWTAPGYDDSNWNWTTAPRQSTLLITELNPGASNWLEIQNVTGQAIDTSGWFVAINDSSLGIAAVNSTVWTLPSSITSQQMLLRTDDPASGNYWGSDIDWNASQGWAMIVDGQGQVVDFVPWGYDESQLASLSVAAGGFQVSLAGQWTGAPVIVGQGGIDIGNPDMAGSSSYNSATSTYTVAGGGADIWSTYDQFYFLHQEMVGDGEIVARVASIGNTDSWAKAGIMIREGLTASSAHAMVVRTSGNGISFQGRATTGGESSHITPGGVNTWVRLVRQGDTFLAYQRANSWNSWSLIGSMTIPMGESVYVGLAVTSHNNAQLCTATFTNVSKDLQTGSLKIIREGNTDRNTKLDFATAIVATPGVQNTALVVPFPVLPDDPATTGIGYNLFPVGFDVSFYKANVSVGNLTVAEQVIATPSMQSWVATETTSAINYLNTGDAGNFAGDRPYPGTSIGVDANHFVIRAVATILIPEAGYWTFAVNSDDGFRLTISDVNTVSVTNSSTLAGSNSISFYGGRGPADTMGVYHFDQPGYYSLELVQFEGEGGSSVELFAAQGSFSSFNPSDFALVGNTAAGGLATSGYGGGLRTDVSAAMYGVNSSIWLRMPFEVGADVDLAEFIAMTLRMRYNDGFVAYLNGVEIARRNAPSSLAWNSTATVAQDPAAASIFQNIDVTAFLALVQPGENVLAIQGLNVAADSADFFILPELTLRAPGYAEHYFADPTPGAPNNEGRLGFVADVQFSVPHGFHDEAFLLSLTTNSANATIRYTLDGSTPTAGTGIVYTEPLWINQTTVLRAAAFEPEYYDSRVITQTYIFLADVIQQSSDGQAPDGWPTNPINGQVFYYGMHPSIVEHAVWGQQLIEAMQSIPTLSMVTDSDNLFDPASGIYVNAGQRGRAWERPMSLELIYPDGTVGFQVDAGVRIRGGFSRSTDNPKHAFRIFFRSDYGEGRLDYPLFGDLGAESFDKIDLRTSQNYSWAFQNDARNSFLRDIFARDVQLAMGQPATRSEYYHLYINGQYFGLYMTQERAEAEFAASYFGGDSDDYDVIKHSPESGYRTEVTDGNFDAYQRLWEASQAGFAANADYYAVQGLNPDGTSNPALERLVDVDNLIDYMIGIYYGGDLDAPVSNFLGNNRVNNFYAIYNREAPDGFKFFRHDSEHTLDTGGADRTGPYTDADLELFQYFNPQTLHQKLTANPEYRMRFADRAHQHLLNEGTLTPARATELLQMRAAEIDLAIIAESARWGASKRTEPLNRDDWLGAVSQVLNFVQTRNTVLLQQFRDRGWFPAVNAPAFRIDGAYQHGGAIDLGEPLTIVASSGTIYYTLDGSDPRQIGGGVSPSALIYSGAVPLNGLTQVNARVLSGGVWSALNAATYHIDLAPHVRVTEIMFNPGPLTAAETAAGFTDRQSFEFIELMNTSTTLTLPLTGVAFSEGIQFTFPDITLGPGQRVVVVSDLNAFNLRYPAFAGVVAGAYVGRLSNSGERLTLDMAVGGTIQDFAYNNTWYSHADGQGYSLTIRDPLGSLPLWNTKDGWRTSEPPNGTPGADEAELGYQVVNPGGLLITEVLAHSNLPNVDMVELYNASSSAIDLSGWFISDRLDDLTRGQLPAMPPLQPGQYLVLYEGVHMTTFNLSEFGEAFALTSNFAGLPGGFREQIVFGATPPDVSVGRYVKSTGEVDFPLQSQSTFGGPNAYPLVDALVINEIMYNPPPPTPAEIAAGFTDPQDFEFLELYNRSAAAIDLRNYYLGDGVGFTFGWYDAGTLGTQVWTLEPGATATWSASLSAGLTQYEVFARWDLLDPLGNPRALDDQARYEIAHAGGATQIVRNQGVNSGDGWVSLGVYWFDGNGEVVLTRTVDSASRWTIADQVKFVRTSDQQTILVDQPALDSWYTSNGPATLGPGERLVIARDLAAFDLRYDIAGSGILVAGTYSGRLNNAGELVSLYRAGIPEVNGYIAYYNVEYVDYGNAAPWPTEAAGHGPSLNRLGYALFGNDPAHWDAGAAWGTPGAANIAIDRTPPTTPTGLQGRVSLGPPSITVSWNAASDTDSHVAYYVVYRDGNRVGISASTSFEDGNVAALQDGVTYQYRVSAVNRDGFEGQLSTVAAVKLPGIAYFGMPNNLTISITFTEAVTAASAAQLSNYLMTGRSLVSASLQPDGRTVVLTTNGQLAIGGFYTVTIVGMDTVSGSEMPHDQRIQFVYEPVAAGSVLRQWWTGIGGTALNDLTSHPNYPNNPSGSELVTAYFEGPVGFGESYGTRFQGFIHAPVSGEYIFWFASDDNGQLWLSTDADPANKRLIASVSEWTDSRQWTKFASQQSVAITLMAGQKYYIEALQKEGGGGDNVAVRWQLPGGVWENPAQPNLPIPASRLSPWTADTTAPQAAVIPVHPAPRTMPVDSISIVFSERIAGFDLADLVLNRNGGANLLTGGETLTTTDNITWTLGNLGSLTGNPGNYSVTLAAGSGIQDTAGNSLAAGSSTTWTTLAANVVGRHVFYNGSAFDAGDVAANAADDGAIAPDKSALLPGATATFANYTSYSRGINGLMIDVAGLYSTTLEPSDFQFRVGNSADPATWTAAPQPLSITVRPGAGANGSNRVTIVWANGEVANTWLQVTLRATAATGLAADDVFYFGNAMGETGNAPNLVEVNRDDETLTVAERAGLTVMPLSSPYDFNRDKLVSAADVMIARRNAATSLVVLQAPLLTPAAVTPAALPPATLTPTAEVVATQLEPSPAQALTAPLEAALTEPTAAEVSVSQTLIVDAAPPLAHTAADAGRASPGLSARHTAWAQWQADDLLAWTWLEPLLRPSTTKPRSLLWSAWSEEAVDVAMGEPTARE
jgi:hypothetical protein